MNKTMSKQDVASKPLGGLVQAYLMASHLYYNRNESVMEDDVFDAICKRLHDEYDDIPKDHIHYHLVDKDALRAGTAYQIGNNYPDIVRVAADMWLRSIDEDVDESRRRRFGKNYSGG